ncbi:MAG: SET domain-containing protein [bacterium]|nr:SET domain-containing protein [bacterium]
MASFATRKKGERTIYFVLGQSFIQGVGVFAALDIPAGSFLGLFDNEDADFIKFSDIEYEEEKALIEKYGVRDEDGFWVPHDFHKMCIGWYLNHSDTPNIYHDEQYNYFAQRDINAGEELTVDYKTLGEESVPYGN